MASDACLALLLPNYAVSGVVTLAIQLPFYSSLKSSIIIHYSAKPKHMSLALLAALRGAFRNNVMGVTRLTGLVSGHEGV